MADPHGEGAIRGGGMGSGVGKGGAGDVAARIMVGARSDVEGGGENAFSPDVEVVQSPEILEEDKREVGSDLRVLGDEPEVSGTVVPSFGSFDRDVHGCDLEKSRALHVEDGKVLNSFDISRAISNVVGPGTVDHHFGTWDQIDLILASIPGARIAITTTTATKLKTHDYRKIHTQEALNLNPSLIPSLTKLPKSKFTSKAAQQFLPPPKPSKKPNLSQKPKTSRPSQPSKIINPSHLLPLTHPGYDGDDGSCRDS